MYCLWAVCISWPCRSNCFKTEKRLLRFLVFHTWTNRSHVWCIHDAWKRCGPCMDRVYTKHTHIDFMHEIEWTMYGSKNLGNAEKLLNQPVNYQKKNETKDNIIEFLAYQRIWSYYNNRITQICHFVQPVSEKVNFVLKKGTSSNFFYFALRNEDDLFFTCNFFVKRLTQQMASICFEPQLMSQDLNRLFEDFKLTPFSHWMTFWSLWAIVFRLFLHFCFSDSCKWHGFGILLSHCSCAFYSHTRISMTG